MGVVVDQIVSEYIAKVQGHNQDVQTAVAALDAYTAAIERNNRAGAKADSESTTSRKRRTGAEVQAAREQATIQKQAAKEIAEAEKAASKAAADAVKASTRAQAADVRAAEREKQAAIKETQRVAEQAAATEASSARRMANIDATIAAQAGRPSGTRSGPLKGTGNNDGPQRPLASNAAAYINGAEPSAAAAREINHEIAERASLQAGLVASTREETVLIRDQLTQLNLVAQYKRAGYTETEAAIRAEEALSALEGRRVRQAEELATAQAAATAKQQAALEKQIAAQATKVSSGISLFTGALVGGVTVGELSHLNDEYIKFSNSLKVAGVSAADFANVQDHLLKTSTRTGANIGALADTYRSIALASHDLGASQSDILRVTDALANSLRITGASGGAARAAILQLGHAFETGRVTAREFNGLALNAYPILQAAAAGSDKYAGSVSKLRAALLAGDLSSKDLFDSILKGSDMLESRANKAALTTAQGFTALQNALVVYIGSADQANGVSAALGRGLQLIAQNLDTLIPAIAAVGVALSVGFTARMIGAAESAAKLRAAMLAAFGGPVGLVLTALVVSLASFSITASEASDSAAKSAESLASLKDELGTAGAMAKTAAGGVSGFGKDALGAIPSVNSFAGAVGNLAQQLYNQARAARVAQVETFKARLASAQKDEADAKAKTPSGQEASADQARGALRRGNLFAGIPGALKDAYGRIANTLSAGENDQNNIAAYRDKLQARLLIQAQYQKLTDTKNNPIGIGDLPQHDTPTDPKTVKALAGLNTKLDGLEKLAGGATGKRLERINNQIETTKKKIEDINSGVSVSAANAAEGGGGRSGRRGPSAEALAHRAESARLKAVHDDEGYTTALKQAHDQELQAAIDLSHDAQARADLERQRVRDAADETAKNIRAKGPKDAKLNGGVAGTGERNAEETGNLLGYNTRLADLNLAKIDQAERRRNAEDLRSLDLAEIDARRDALQSQQQQNLTLAQRRRLALDLLDLDYQQKAIELQAIKDDTTKSDAERVIAGDKLRALPDRKAADEKGLDRQYQGAGASYLEGLKLDKPQFLQSEEVKVLDDFNRGLDDSVKKALHLHGIFGDIIGDLIDMAIRQAVIKPIANALFGGSGDSGSSGGGGIGGFLGTILGAFTGGGGQSTAATNAAAFSLPGFASGGSFMVGGTPGTDKNMLSIGGQPRAMVGAHEMVTVTNPNVAASNRSVQAAAPQYTVLAPRHYDLTNSLIDRNTLAQMNAENRAYADAVGKAAAQYALGPGLAKVRRDEFGRS